MFKSGFIGIIGRPNVGKSTLLNNILQQKISIITSTAQTTRSQIRGILSKKDFQMVFVDTPGIHTAQDNLGTFLNKIAFKVIKNVDFILFLAPANETIGKNDLLILKKLSKNVNNCLITITKSDLVSKKEIDIKKAEWKKHAPNFKIINISALKSINLNLLINHINEQLEEGPQYYPDNMVSDQTESYFIREIIREHILKNTWNEIPHSVVITLDEMEETTKLVKIFATIIVKRNSQKAIIIGHKGKVIKKISQDVRINLEKYLGIKIYIRIFVKVIKNWDKKLNIIKKIDYE